MKLDLLTNATVVDDAIRFVSDSNSEHKCGNLHQQSGNEQELTYVTPTNQVF